MAKIKGITSTKADEIEDSILSSVELGPNTELIFNREDGSTLELDEIGVSDAKFSPSIVSLGSDFIPSHEVVIPEWLYPGDKSVRLADPSGGNIPPAGLVAMDWLPDGSGFAVGSASSPYVLWYSISGATLTRRTDPTGATGTPTSLAWSPDGRYLAVTSPVGPYVDIFRRNTESTLTKLASPADLPTGSARDVSWDSTGTYLVVAHDTSPYITIYKRSGTTFTKLADPATLPAGNAFTVSWLKNASRFAVGHANSPYLSLYTMASDVATKGPNPSILPNAQVVRLVWHPEDGYLAFLTGTSPYVFVYSRSGNVLTKESSPTVTPPAAPGRIKFSPDGKYLAVSHATSSDNGFQLYSFDKDGSETVQDPLNTTVNGKVFSWAPSGYFLLTASDSSPYLVWYNSTSRLPRGIPAERAFVS